MHAHTQAHPHKYTHYTCTYTIVTYHTLKISVESFYNIVNEFQDA